MLMVSVTAVNASTISWLRDVCPSSMSCTPGQAQKVCVLKAKHINPLALFCMNPILFQSFPLQILHKSWSSSKNVNPCESLHPNIIFPFLQPSVAATNPLSSWPPCWVSTRGKADRLRKMHPPHRWALQPPAGFMMQVNHGQSMSI